MSNLIQNNSELLFLFDAQKTNPNGDMDNENKPRMDWEAGRNLVSDVRLKRYIREYLQDVEKKPIFVRKFGDKALKAKEALNLFKLLHINGKKEEELNFENIKEVKETELKKDIGGRLFDMADIRFFGATIPISIDEGKGSSQTYTGPIQFNWGHSLNRITELQESNTITSNLNTGQSDEGAGAGIGKDYRVNYSLIAFSGGINANVAEHTKLTGEDVSLLDKAMVKSIPLNRTRSKIGQTPRLYVRVELKDNVTTLNDLREYVTFNPKVEESQVREISEYSLDCKELSDYIEKNKNKIKAIHFWKDDKLQTENFNLPDNLVKNLNY